MCTGSDNGKRGSHGVRTGGWQKCQQIVNCVAHLFGGHKEEQIMGARDMRAESLQPKLIQHCLPLINQRQMYMRIGHRTATSELFID